jgi:hypothetical protein
MCVRAVCVLHYRASGENTFPRCILRYIFCARVCNFWKRPQQSSARKPSSARCISFFQRAKIPHLLEMLCQPYPTSGANPLQEKLRWPALGVGRRIHAPDRSLDSRPFRSSYNGHWIVHETSLSPCGICVRQLAKSYVLLIGWSPPCAAPCAVTFLRWTWMRAEPSACMPRTTASCF